MNKSQIFRKSYVNFHLEPWCLTLDVLERSNSRDYGFAGSYFRKILSQVTYQGNTNVDLWKALPDPWSPDLLKVKGLRDSLP